MTLPVAIAAEAATEAAEQEDDEDDDKYEADRHDLSPVTTPSQTFVASSYSDCEAPVWHFPDDALSREPSWTELLLFDGNAALADIDLDPGRLVPLLRSAKPSA